MKKIFLIALVALCSLTACSKNPEQLPGQDGTQVGMQELSEMVSGGDKFADLNYPKLENVNISYMAGTDDQPDASERLVYTEAGYYELQSISLLDLSKNGSRLSYYDYAADKSVPVCSRSGCTHDNEECDAFFADAEYPLPDIWYYNGNLYIFSVEEDYYNITRVAPDGSSRDISCRLYRTTMESHVEDDSSTLESKYFPKLTVHRGYVWFSTYYPGCKQCGLFRVKLDSKEEREKICSLEDNYPTIYRLKGYGDYLFFQMGVFLDEAGTEPRINLYACDVQTGEAFWVLQNVVRNYTLEGESLYYEDWENNDNIMRYDFSSGDLTKVWDSGGQETAPDIDIFVRDDTLYFASSDQLQLFDMEGNPKGTLGTDKIRPY